MASPLTDHRPRSDALLDEQLLLYLGLDRHYDKFLHHTILIGDRYKGLSPTFLAVASPRLLDSPPCPHHDRPSMAPPGHESVYLLVPVPHLGGSPPVDWATYGDTFRDKIITYLEHDRPARLRRQHPNRAPLHPARLPARTRRALLGTAGRWSQPLFQSAYFRPHNRSEDVRGLYPPHRGHPPRAAALSPAPSSPPKSPANCRGAA
ncbi:MAG: hypothetical protein U0841_17910 [Chloroflexia bacterium]